MAQHQEGEIAAVSLQARIPPFWRHNPRLWFAQFEAVVAPQNLGEDRKFELVIPALDTRDIDQVGDIILETSSGVKYSKLRDRLISLYQESANSQLEKLLGGLELGDQKPSQLLRKMRDLNRNMLADEALKHIWLRQIPKQIRSILAVTTEKSLDTLAEIADKILEQQEIGPTIACVTTPSNSNTQNLQMELMAKQIEKLTIEIAELRTERDSDRRRYRYRSHSRRSSHSRRRSRSRAYSPSRKMNPNDEQELCWYHHRFGDKARRCESPCTKLVKKLN